VQSRLRRLTFENAYWMHHRGYETHVTLMMKAVRSTSTSCPVSIALPWLHQALRTTLSRSFQKVQDAYTIKQLPQNNKDHTNVHLHTKAKAVPLHAMKALCGRWYTAPTHSWPRH
jgi:hypothetical protein